jgi:hypothetical protein
VVSISVFAVAAQRIGDVSLTYVILVNRGILLSAGDVGNTDIIYFVFAEAKGVH